MIAHVTNLKPGEFIHTLGDAHIYMNHVDVLKEQVRNFGLLDAETLPSAVRQNEQQLPIVQRHTDHLLKARDSVVYIGTTVPRTKTSLPRGTVLVCLNPLLFRN